MRPIEYKVNAANRYLANHNHATIAVSMLPTTCPVCQHQPLRFDGEDAICGKCGVYRQRLKFIQRVIIWTKGKTSWWRILLVLAWFALLLQASQNTDLQRNNPVALFDLGIHELGHVLFIPFGTFMTILGGSLFQCLFPLLWFGACLWKKWYFAAALCLAWCGYNLYDVAVYAADAQDRLLPLATFSNSYDEAHDWYQILTRLGSLQSDATIAQGLRIAGGGFMIVGLLIGAALIGLMFYWWYKRADDGEEPDDTDAPPARDPMDYTPRI